MSEISGGRSSNADTRSRSHFDKYWWLYVIAALFLVNLIVKNRMMSGMVSECRESIPNVDCSCMAEEVADQIGPVYLFYALGVGLDRDKRADLRRRTGRLCLQR